MTAHVGESSPHHKLETNRRKAESLARRPGPTIALPWATGNNDGVQQTVTADTEVTWATVETSDPTVFAKDPDTASGICILKAGVYAFFAAVRVLSGSIGVPRSIYNSVQPLSSGPVFGSELGQNEFAAGAGQRQSSLGEVDATNTISKSVLNHLAVVPLHGFSFETNPPRHAVVAMHLGTSWTIGNLASAVWIVQLSPDATGEAMADFVP